MGETGQYGRMRQFMIMLLLYVRVGDLADCILELYVTSPHGTAQHSLFNPSYDL